MLFLVIHLTKQEYQADVLTALAEVGLTEAAVLNGTSSKRMIALDVPIFAGLKTEFGRESAYCKVITASIEDVSVVDEFLAALKEAGIDFVKDSLGSILVLPVDKFVGGE
jgi:hypothetical protein